jgi:RNA exonuclease 4
MPSENWKKLLSKKKIGAAQSSSTPNNAMESKEADDAVSSALMASVALEAQLNADVTTHSYSVKDDKSECEENDGGKDDDEEDLLDSLKSNGARALSKVSQVHLDRIPEQFRPKAGDFTPSSSIEWFSFLNKVSGLHSVKEGKLGKYVALDCEMVGVGENGEESMLARISIVNFHGICVLDEYVAPAEKVVDYRTAVSGITPSHLKSAPPLSDVMVKLGPILKDRIVVGHSLHNDFAALMLSHPKHLIRDTANYHMFKKSLRTTSPSLKRLAKEYLGLDIQTGEHDSVEDARIAMLIYRLHRDQWDDYTAKLARYDFQTDLHGECNCVFMAKSWME